MVVLLSALVVRFFAGLIGPPSNLAGCFSVGLVLPSDRTECFFVDLGLPSDRTACIVLPSDLTAFISVGTVALPSDLVVWRRGQGGGIGLDGGGVRLLPHGVGLGNIDTWGVGLGVAGTVVVGHRLAHRSHFRLVSVCNTSPSFRTNKSSTCTVNLKRKSRFLRVQGSYRFLETKLKDFSMTLNFP